jgi:hypothetical protein
MNSYLENMEVSGAATFIRRSPFPLRRARLFNLMMDRELFGELSVYKTHVILPAGKHHISLAWGTKPVSNEIEVEISPKRPLVLEYKEGWRFSTPVSIRPRPVAGRSQKILSSLPKMCLIIFILLGTLGLLRGAVGVLDSIAYYLISKLPSSKVSAAFWNDLTVHGALTAQSNTSLSQEFREKINIDWSKVGTQLSSSVGTNVYVIIKGSRGTRGRSGAKSTVDLEIQGDDGIVHVTTFLTRKSGDVRPRISGFDITYGLLNLEIFSEHLLFHLKPSILITGSYPTGEIKSTDSP